MAAGRILPLWAITYRCIETNNPALRSAIAAQRIRAYHPSRRRQQQEQIPQRYGTANEPPPHLGGGKAPPPSTTEQKPEDAKALPKIGESLQKDGEKEVKTFSQEPSDPKREPATVEGRQAASPQMYDPMLDSHDTSTIASPSKPGSTPNLDSIMHTVLDNPEDQTSQSSHAEDHPDKTFDEHSPPIKAPHIEAPRYIHHFDTHGLVLKLKDGHWDNDRAITIMKAMRLILADNTDLAKEALVSKSNLENEAYLFKAACAELKTEVTTRRKSEQEKMRTERTQLQHEVDIISQDLSQKAAVLKDELKGLFDDRKMAVRNEQRDMESKIQGMNNMITVELQADAKSEVEGLRWIMTRRVIITLVLVVAQVIGGLKLFSTLLSAEEGPKKKSGGSGSASPEVVVIDESGKRVSGGGGELVVKEGDSAGFVSLG